MLRLTPLPKLARNSETGGAQGDIIDTIFFTVYRVRAPAIPPIPCFVVAQCTVVMAPFTELE